MNLYGRSSYKQAARLLQLATVVVAMAASVLSAQSPSEIQKAVDGAYSKYRGLKEGKNADYIPALAQVDPNLFGIAVVTQDGKVYSAGDLKTEVSIQSISKVFTMAQVIQEQGPDVIEKTIGVDATGMRFNSIVAIEFVRSAVGTGAAEMNPLVNPGAIATTGLVKGATADEVWKKIIGFHNESAGRPLTVLGDVYKSESDSNQRNQAIGALMYAYGYIKANPQQAVDLYTRQCSIGVNAKDLAMMGATLAFGGKNPATGKQVIDDLLAELQQRQWGDSEIFGIHLSVEEALVNAIKHGNEEADDKSVHVVIKMSDDSMRIDWALLVPLSVALTFRMPFASMSNVTSICGTPRGAGGMPSRLNWPRSRLSAHISRSPWNTRTVTAV